MLKLTGEMTYVPCPTCNGTGKVQCPVVFSVRTTNSDGDALRTPGDGKPIPCPECNGKKVVSH